MRKLVEYIAQSLVDDPSAVQVREVRNDRNALVLELHVAPDDFGKVIGRQGRVARAMRTAGSMRAYLLAGTMQRASPARRRTGPTHRAADPISQP